MREGKWTSYVATAVNKYGEGAVTKAFFTVSEEYATTENSYIPRVYNSGNRTWETKVIPSQIWTNR
jgi:hypothetical protein